jgi:hypothetical protein
MTVHDLIRRLRQARVPDWLYVTDGGLGTGECYGIEPAATGWSLYYSERGRKAPIETHPDEDAACRSLLRHLDAAMRSRGQGGIPGA